MGYGQQAGGTHPTGILVVRRYIYLYFETRYFARYISTGNITFAAKLLTQVMSCVICMRVFSL